jgi:predicted nucleic acid-binding Zn ribbon protein
MKMGSILAVDPIQFDETEHRCQVCSKRIYDRELKYCSARCKEIAKHDRKSLNEVVSREIKILMEQYRKGGIGENYYEKYYS